MKRYVKFRGKDLNTGKWVFGNLLHPITSCRIVNYTEAEEDGAKRADYHYLDVDPDTVGQFTGLYDSTGKEIYEDDILVSECSGVAVNYIEVFWSDDKAAFLVEDYNPDRQTTGNCDYLSMYDTAFYTIYSNNHDNPELLGKV